MCSVGLMIFECSFLSTEDVMSAVMNKSRLLFTYIKLNHENLPQPPLFIAQKIPQRD